MQSSKETNEAGITHCDRTIKQLIRNRCHKRIRGKNRHAYFHLSTLTIFD